MNLIQWSLKKVRNLTKVWRVSAPKEICARAGQGSSGCRTLQNLRDTSSFPVQHPKAHTDAAPSPRFLTMWLAGRPPGPVLWT